MKSNAKTSGDITAGAQQQAGAGGPVKKPATGPGTAAGHAAAVIGAHQSASAPGGNMAKAVGHMSAGTASGK